jgi:hypothetical protein
VSDGGRIVLTGQDVTELGGSTGVTRFAACPVKAYSGNAQQDPSANAWQVPEEFLRTIEVKAEIELDAPPRVAANFGRVRGTPHIFLANFTGLVPGKVASPTPERDVRVRIPASMGNSLAYLPFLGETQTLRGTNRGDKMEFILPPLERGAVVWVGGKE